MLRMLLEQHGDEGEEQTGASFGRGEVGRGRRRLGAAPFRPFWVEKIYSFLACSGAARFLGSFTEGTETPLVACLFLWCIRTICF